MRKLFCPFVTAILFLSVIMAIILAAPARAQAPTPLDNLTIAFWPEYDQPSVLVIYRATVPEDVSLPAPVSFTLPQTVASVHAVAYVDEERGTLVNIQPFDFVAGASGKVLSFTTPARQFQFEYYSSDMLSFDENRRQLSFSFTPSAAISALTLELQQPSQADEFNSDPAPTLTESRPDGLTYTLYDLGDVPAGQSVSLEVRYTRPTDELSVSRLEGVNVTTDIEQKPVEVGGGGLMENLGPILIAVGVLLLVGALGYWFWSQRTVGIPEPSRRQPAPQPRRAPRRREAAPSRTFPAPGDRGLAAYCHRCGTKLREDAQFCHACGAERRAD